MLEDGGGVTIETEDARTGLGCYGMLFAVKQLSNLKKQYVMKEMKNKPESVKSNATKASAEKCSTMKSTPTPKAQKPAK